MSRASVKPASWNRRSVSWPIRTTGSAGYPGNAIDGIATSVLQVVEQPGHERGRPGRDLLRIHRVLRSVPVE